MYNSVTEDFKIANITAPYKMPLSVKYLNQQR